MATYDRSRRLAHLPIGSTIKLCSVAKIDLMLDETESDASGLLSPPKGMTCRMPMSSPAKSLVSCLNLLSLAAAVGIAASST